MNNRELCKCGCGTSVRDRRYGTVWATEGCRKAFQRHQRRAVTDRTRTRPRTRTAEPRLSYQKALGAVLALTDRYDSQLEEALKGALSDRQRASLEERQAA